MNGGMKDEASASAAYRRLLANARSEIHAETVSPASYQRLVSAAAIESVVFLGVQEKGEPSFVVRRSSPPEPGLLSTRHDPLRLWLHYDAAWRRQPPPPGAAPQERKLRWLCSMWFEQFYSGVITTGFVAAALYLSYPFNKWDTGRAHRRDYCTPQRVELSKRDHNLTGNQYRISGLESIRD